MQRTDGRQVNRTKLALRQALLALIARKGYDRITVQELVERADVGRATFYSHYADKDDVLRENLTALGDHIRDQINKGAERGPLAFSLPLLRHVEEVQPMFTALLGAKGSPTVRQLFLDVLAGLIAEGLPDGAGDLPAPRSAVVGFLAAGFLAVARWWVVEAPQQNAGEVHKIYLRLAAGGITR
jgi:AcrR family transcriptional regulator